MTFLASLMVAVGLFAAIVAVNQRSNRRVRDLSSLLQEYSPDSDSPAVNEDDDLRAAFASTGRLAERALGGSGLLAKVRATLLRSDWTISPGEFVAVSVAVAALGFLVGLLSGTVVLAFVLVLLGLLLPYVLVARSVSVRRRRFDDQLPDVLDLLAASLESGNGLSQALELVVAEAADPAASEFARVLTATRLGATLVEGLEEMSERLDSRDLTYTVQAITVQQTTGGRLAEVLHIVAEFMRSRFELKRELSALTAEGRLSAYILGGLPIALAGLIAVISPGYLNPLFTTLPGLILTFGALVLMGIAFIIMAKIIRIEV